MTTLAEELLAYLGRKGCAMSLRRIVEDFRKPQQEIEANLDSLRRRGLAQILRPGEWEITPPKIAAAVPPVTPPAVAHMRAPEPTQETTMPFKTCDKCEQKKGPRAFDKGDSTCRECRGSNKSKPPGGVATPKKKTNGAVRSLREIRKKHAKPNGTGRFAGAIEHLKAARAELLGDVEKIDAAILQIQALG